jgi:DNA-binding CsgD family transcriptional regulator
MDNVDYDVHYFHYARDHNGKLVPVGTARRNKRMVPRFDPSITEPEPPGGEESKDYRELVEEVTYCLTPLERRTLLRLADGLPVVELAREENVSRQAIYCRLAAMIRKNEYCAIAAVHGVLRKKTNQHA